MSEFQSSQRVSLPLWALAAIGAVVVHLGCVALALAFVESEPEDNLGAPAVEIGVELLAPHADPTDLPPGPDVAASIAAPQVTEQAAVAEPTDLPRAVPVETEDPERVVAAVETIRPEDEPNAPAVPAVPSVESVAVEATAPPTSEIIQESTRSITPAQGTGASVQRIRATWEKELIAHFNRHKRYPTDRSVQTAEMLVSFVLDDTGHILSSAIVQGSGDASFDEAALAMLRRSDPVPKPPSLVAKDGLSFTLPVIFRAKRGN